MKKQLIKCMLIAVTFGMIASMNAVAADENTDNTPTESSSLLIDASSNIWLMSDNAMNQDVRAARITLEVAEDDAKNIDQIALNFAEENNIKITDYRYNAETRILSIYVADANPIFNKSNALKIGSVAAENESGEAMTVQLLQTEDSLDMTSSSDHIPTTVILEDKSPASLPKDAKLMNVSKTYPVSYVVTIPDSSDNLKLGDTLMLKAEDVMIEYNEALEVSVTSENDWNLKDAVYDANPEKVSYKLGFGEDDYEITGENAKILEVSGSRHAGITELTVMSIGTPSVAGTYKDTLTFNVTVD